MGAGIKTSCLPTRVSKTSSHAGPGEELTRVPGGGMDGVITVQLADHDIEDTYEGF
jgi:hypothetical protein